MLRSLLAGFALLVSFGSAIAQEGLAPVPVLIKAQAFDRFHTGLQQQDFGAFRFVGGLNLLTSSRQFGGISGFRFLDDSGTHFAAVSDFGYVIAGHIERDARDKPLGWGDVEIAPLPNQAGDADTGKVRGDAEGLAVRDGALVVAFEHNHRIKAFAYQRGQALRPMDERFDYLVPDYEIRRNKGFETLLVSDAGSALGGALVAITERSINKAGDIFASVLSGPRKGVFFVKRRDQFDVTDAVALPDGDILLLERRFNMRQGVAMRLRKIAVGDIKPNATVDGSIVLDADFSHQIDNMEGMDLWRDAAGRLRLGLVSDDNRSFLQRSLYLEFIIDEAAL